MANIYTRHESQLLDKAILDAEAARYTTDETIAYIKEKLDFKLSRWSVNWRKRELQQGTIDHFKRIRADQWAYKLILLQRIEALEQLIEDNQRLRLQVRAQALEDPDEHLDALLKLNSQIAQFNRELLDLYLLAPAIDGIGARWNSGSDETGLTEQSATEQGSADPEAFSQRKF